MYLAGDGREEERGGGGGETRSIHPVTFVYNSKTLKVVNGTNFTASLS